MSARVNVPLEDATRMVELNFGWKRSREGPERNATVPLMRGAERRSYTCAPDQALLTECLAL